MKIPITNILLGGNRRRKRAALGLEATSNEQNETVDYDYLAEDYFNFYGTGNEYLDEHEDFGDSDEEIEGLPKDVYCDIVETLRDTCGEYSILEIWKYDKEVISNLTNQDIINAINTVHESPIFGYETNYANYLGQVDYNATGHVVKAKSMRSIWLEEVHLNEGQKGGNLLSVVDFEKVDPFTLGYCSEMEQIPTMYKITADALTKSLSK